MSTTVNIRIFKNDGKYSTDYTFTTKTPVYESNQLISEADAKIKSIAGNCNYTMEATNGMQSNIRLVLMTDTRI